MARPCPVTRPARGRGAVVPGADERRRAGGSVPDVDVALPVARPDVGGGRVEHREVAVLAEARTERVVVERRPGTGHADALGRRGVQVADVHVVPAARAAAREVGRVAGEGHRSPVGAQERCAQVTVRGLAVGGDRHERGGVGQQVPDEQVGARSRTRRQQVGRVGLEEHAKSGGADAHRRRLSVAGAAVGRDARERRRVVLVVTDVRVAGAVGVLREEGDERRQHRDPAVTVEVDARAAPRGLAGGSADVGADDDGAARQREEQDPRRRARAAHPADPATDHVESLTAGPPFHNGRVQERALGDPAGRVLRRSAARTRAPCRCRPRRRWVVTYT